MVLRVGPVPDIAKAIDESCRAFCTARSCAMQFVQPQEHQRDQHGDKGCAIDHENPARADRRDQRAGNGRADHTRGVERGRIQRHGISKIGLANQFSHESMPRRRVEGGDAAQGKREDIDVPQLDKAADGEHVRGRRRGRLRRPACRATACGGRNGRRRNRSMAAAADADRIAAPSRMPMAVALLWVSWVSTSQPCAMRCIQVPILDTSAPAAQTR